MTVLLTTHYMEEADLVCDRVALMPGGRIQTEGPPAVLKGRRGGAAVGALGTPKFGDVKAEFARAEALVPAALRRQHLIAGKEEKPCPFGSPDALDKCTAVKLTLVSEKDPEKPDTRVVDPRIVEQIQKDFAGYR